MQMEIWRHMFVLGLPWAEKVLRPIAVYAFLIVGLRLAGKRELAQLNPFDLELEAAAHKQGFMTLDEIDRAVLDPNGSIAFFAKRPNPDTMRHEELLKRLD